jgi:hypothetical protein
MLTNSIGKMLILVGKRVSCDPGRIACVEIDLYPLL